MRPIMSDEKMNQSVLSTAYTTQPTWFKIMAAYGAGFISCDTCQVVQGGEHECLRDKRHMPAAVPCCRLRKVSFTPRRRLCLMETTSRTGITLRVTDKMTPTMGATIAGVRSYIMLTLLLLCGPPVTFVAEAAAAIFLYKAKVCSNTGSISCRQANGIELSKRPVA